MVSACAGSPRTPRSASACARQQGRDARGQPDLQLVPGRHHDLPQGDGHRRVARSTCARGFDLEGRSPRACSPRGADGYEVPITYRARGREEGKKLTGFDALRVIVDARAPARGALGGRGWPPPGSWSARSRSWCSWLGLGRARPCSKARAPSWRARLPRPPQPRGSRRARDAYRRAREFNADSAPASARPLRQLLGAGATRWTCSEVTRREPENADAWILLAGIARARPALAARATERARELNPLAFRPGG